MPGTLDRPDDLTVKVFPQTKGGSDQSVVESFSVGDTSFSYTYDPISYEGPAKQAQIDASTISVEETIELAANAVKAGRLDTQRSLAGSEEVSDAVKLKLTIDLGHSNISRIPEPVVDLIKDEVERLSLSHNQIWHLPYRFAECSQLRYLNVRTNFFKEFPKAVYKLPLLEILDLSRNRIRRVPNEIKNLASLRVLSIQHNRLEELPPSLCEMSKLNILKVAGNPLRFTLKRVLEAKEAEVAKSNMTENEKEAAVTAEIKGFLKTKLPITRADIESGGESSEGPLDTPKPIKRGLTSRFPVIPSTSGSDSASDAHLLRPPPIPTRSHYRVASGNSSSSQSGPPPRPGIAPLSAGNERNRSNSESVLQASSAAKTKRMGIMRKNTELDSVEEARVNRHSHLRGQSHGSALRSKHSNGTVRSGSSSSPNSPRFGSPKIGKGGRKHRGDLFVRPLSALPEYKEEGPNQDNLVEGAKGVLFSLFQVHPHIGTLINVVKSDDTKRNSLEAVFYNASTHFERLNEVLEKYHVSSGEDENINRTSKAALKRECQTCLMAYTQVGSQLRFNIPRIVTNGDSRYVRSLMLLIYGSLIEARNALKSMNISVQPQPQPKARTNGTAKPSEQNIAVIPEEIAPVVSVDRATTPTRERPQQAIRRLRSDTAFQTSSYQSTNAPLPPPPPPMPLYLNNRSRSNSHTNPLALSSTASSVANTPRSGDSFNLTTPSVSGSRITTMQGIDELEEERTFERIFHQLTYAYDYALKALPLALRQFSRALENAEQTRAAPDVRRTWYNLILRCKACIELSESLKVRLSNMKVNQPGAGARNQRDFWLLCKSFMQSFVDLISDMRDVKSLVPRDVVIVLKPVHKASRDAGKLIDLSPWSYLADVSTAPGGYQQGSTASPVNVPLPATPLSAALGPAAQATVPSTPASAAYSTDRFFQGDVFQRADSLLSMPQPLAYRRQ